jgi:hypothetical protein
LLIKVSTKIARSYITRNFFRMSRLYEYFDINQDELAMDAVAGLFCLDKESQNYTIVNSFRLWKPPVVNEEDAFYFLNKMTASAVEQYLSEMLRGADPVFSKIYNALNYIVKKNCYSKIDHIGCKYIIRQKEEGIRKKMIDPDSFENIPPDYFSETGKNLDEIFDYIDLMGFYPAIPFNLLVLRLKRISFHIPVQGVNSPADIDLIIDEAIENVLKELDNFLNIKYLTKGKITREEKGFYLLALRDMTIDMRDGGLNPGIHTYLEKYIPGLHCRESYDRYHNILEYLLKIMKKRIYEGLD